MAATTNAGQFFERCLGPEARVGRLAVGYEADLLLLEGNPLEQALFSGDAAAREIFDRVRQERPGEFLFSQYTPFFVGYGFLYGEDGFSTDPERLATALGLYGMYVGTYPDYHSAHYMLALARRANGDLEGARASLQRALENHPEYVNARKELEALASAD